MSYISPETIEKVREVARVEEVIGEFVDLKRVGANLRGFSPFNTETKPSFYVSPAKQIWTDFSSGKGGDVIKFLMEHEKFNFAEAIRWLAKKYGIEIKEKELNEEEKQARREKESILAVLDFAKKWFMDQMYNTDEGRSVGLGYFKERGFLEKTLKTYETGYSPSRRDALYQAAIQKGYKEEMLEKAGLIIKKNDKVFDRFFERVIFPIHTLSGTVVGFAGRILKDSARAAKYINSPETEVYRKSKLLYGIFQAKASIVKEKQVFLVEGYTDVMAFHQAGIKNTVASAGTALTADQVKLIKRFTDNIVLVYDGDRAGIEAAMRGTDVILENDVNVQVVVLPDGEDPDSYSKKVSPEELIQYLETHKKDFIRFKTEWLLQDQTDPLKKFELINSVLQSIARIPNQIKQELYLKEIASLTGTNEMTLMKELNRILRNRLIRQNARLRDALPEPKMTAEVVQRQRKDKKKLYEAELIKLLLLFGNHQVKFKEYIAKDVINNDILWEKREVTRPVAEKIYLELQADEMEFSSPEFKFLYDLIINEYLTSGRIEPDKILAKIPPEYTQILSQMLVEDEKYNVDDWKSVKDNVPDLTTNLHTWVTDVIYRLRLEWLADLIKKEKEKVAQIEEEADEENLEETLRQIQLYSNMKKYIGDIVAQVLII